MENRDLVKFNENIQFLENGIVKYKDDEGNLKILNAGSLFCQVEFLKVTPEAKKVMIFNREVDKKIEFKKEFTTIPQKDEKNPLKLRDVEIQVELMWKVQNGLGMIKVFNNKDEATKFAEEMNNRIFEKLEVDKNG